MSYTKKIKKLAIGTAQFGLSYGVANSNGQVELQEIANIIYYAKSLGLDTIDTAIAYGKSEENLGLVGVNSFKVISKLPGVSDSSENLSSLVKQSLQDSLSRLKIPRLYGFLLHRPQALLEYKGNELYQALVKLKDDGLVEKIGISIYNTSELDDLIPGFKFDLVQSPYNILDRRLETTGWLSRLKDSGIEVHTRSVFLQGLLLMNSKDRPSYFNAWDFLFDTWHNWLDEQHITPLQGCLNLALLNNEIDRVVVGVESLSQLQEILAATTTATVVPPDILGCNDPNLINPARWRLS